MVKTKRLTKKEKEFLLSAVGVWIVGTRDKEKAFRDINEAYEYRGRLSKINGHHKSIPIRAETWSEEKWRSQVASSSEGKN